MNNRAKNLKEYHDRFGGHIWANNKPSESELKKYLLITYYQRLNKHCFNDHNTFKYMQDEINRMPDWRAALIIDLDTGEQLDFDTEVKLYINGVSV